MRMGRLFGAWLVALALWAAVIPMRSAAAQANFDRPGGDYQNSPVSSGDPADCALVCERDRRCRAWSFNYPTDTAGGAVCWRSTQFSGHDCQEQEGREDHQMHDSLKHGGSAGAQGDHTYE